MPTPPKVADMFSDSTSPVEAVERFDAYKSALAKSLSTPRALPTGPDFAQQSNTDALEKALGSAEISKALSPELVSSVRNSLAEAGLGKAGAAEWTTTNPVSSGLVAFDLESPAKLLTPRPTPLRNRIARKKGVGLAHRFKVISGFTGSGTGGVGIFHPGITESAPATAFGPSSYLRGATISYAGYDQAVNYKQFSASDSVSWGAQFSGQGYEDIRQLSQSTLLYSSMLLEERMLLGGRGTDSGFSGAIVPTVGLAARAANSGGHSGELTTTNTFTTNVWVQVVGHGVWGTGAITTNASVAAVTGNVVDVTITNANSNAATSYDIYWGTGAGSQTAANMFLAASGITGSVFTLQGTLPTAVNATTAPVVDTSAYATGYDGILSYACGANAGYVNHINSTLSVSNPGNEFNVAFASLYDSVKADPDEILANGHDRKQLSDTLKSASGSSYRINLAQDAHSAAIGTLVEEIQNEVTGKFVSLTVHPWLPQGVMPILSWTLPLPDSNVSDVFEVVGPQDYMGIQWPVNQFLYESSSYWFNTFICFAPGWNGAVMGVTAT